MRRIKRITRMENILDEAVEAVSEMMTALEKYCAVQNDF